MLSFAICLRGAAMTDRELIMYEGFQAARAGEWAGNNPYIEMQPRAWWHIGFHAWHQRPCRTGHRLQAVSRPANDFWSNPAPRAH